MEDYYNQGLYVPRELQRYKPGGRIGRGAFGQNNANMCKEGIERIARTDKLLTSRIRFQGLGTFGLLISKNIYQARDLQISGYAAMKFGTEKSRRSDYLSINNEINILRSLNDETVPEREYIIHLLDSYKATGTFVNECSILVLDLCVCDLKKVMTNRNLSYSERKTILLHIFKGLSYLEREKIIHCDVKPRNILLSSQGRMKLSDFGSARYAGGIQESQRYFTMSYASVEMLLGAKNLDFTTDTWSVGCIFADMAGGNKVFTETTRQSQIEEIFDICGTFSDENWDALRTHLPKKYQRRRYEPRPCNLDAWISAHYIRDEDTINLLRSLLVTDPTHRMTCNQALRSPYMLNDVNILPNLIMVAYNISRFHI